MVAGSVVQRTDAQTGVYTVWNLVHVTRDGGRTWTTARMPGGPSAGPQHPLATATSMADPAVAFLPDGTVLYGGSAETQAELDPGAHMRRGYDLFVARSQDGGQTFPGITIVASGSGEATALNPAGIGLPVPPLLFEASDRAALTVASDGTAILAWTDLAELSPKNPVGESCDVVFSSSRDGASWSPAKVVEAGCFNGASPAITHAGVWAIAYVSDKGEMRVARSTDQGATWRATRVGKAFPAYGTPTLRAGPTGNTLALAYPENHGSKDEIEDPTLLMSQDGGATWGMPLVLDRAYVAARTLPAVDVAPDGTVFATYFHVVGNSTGPDARRDYRAVAIRDGALVDAITLDPGVVGPAGALGDYMGLAAMPGGAFAVWVTHHTDAYDVMGGLLRVTAAPAPF
jgi:hypothetical protein